MSFKKFAYKLGIQQRIATLALITLFLINTYSITLRAHSLDQETSEEDQRNDEDYSSASTKSVRYSDVDYEKIFEAITRPTRQVMSDKISENKQDLKQNARITQQQNSTIITTTNQHAKSHYTCAKYCSCSTVKFINKFSNEFRGNFTQVICNDLRFEDIFSIDRETHIIKISISQQEFASQVKKYNIADNQLTNFRLPKLGQFKVLKELVIEGFKFEVCDSEIFKKGQKLIRLRLNNNNLSRISRSCFRHLTKLSDLNLDYNKLVALESTLFSNSIQLKRLSMAYNELTDLEAHQFSNLTKLTHLNLVGNKLTQINLQLFEPMQDSLRILLLSKNQIKSFSYVPLANSTLYLDKKINSSNSSSQISQNLMFKNLIKLNIDHNDIERVKLLQLHRFYNVKYLSLRYNSIETIKDRAFNGLRLIELNLANNKLQSITKCAFCSSTIHRLILSSNVIAIQSSHAIQSSPQTSEAIKLDPSGDHIQQDKKMPAPARLTSSQNFLVLGQSSFLAPLFENLNYLDMSINPFIGDKLDIILEPLINLEYANLAFTSITGSLPSPTMFKNMKNLRYLNLSGNLIDLLTAENIEPLTRLEILDLSRNKFNELEESSLATIDDIPSMRIVNVGRNPWYCSHCKITPLYEWFSRSQIYNTTCIMPLMEMKEALDNDLSEDSEDSSLTTIPVQDDVSIKLKYKMQVEEIPKTDQLDRVFYVTPEDVFDFETLDLNNTDFIRQISKFDEAKDAIATSEDDLSIILTILQITSRDIESNNPMEYCSKCEFPSDLSAYYIHELQPTDFKFCPGHTTRSLSSEPKAGLTVGLVLIGLLFVVIVLVIIIYRKKKDTYFTSEEIDHLDDNNKHILTISSDADQQYSEDATDASSPPLSQSFASYTSGSVDQMNQEVSNNGPSQTHDDNSLVSDDKHSNDIALKVENINTSNVSSSIGSDLSNQLIVKESMIDMNVVRREKDLRATSKKSEQSIERSKKSFSIHSSQSNASKSSANEGHTRYSKQYSHSQSRQQSMIQDQVDRNNLSEHLGWSSKETLMASSDIEYIGDEAKAQKELVHSHPVNYGQKTVAVNTSINESFHQPVANKSGSGEKFKHSSKGLLVDASTSANIPDTKRTSKLDDKKILFSSQVTKPTPPSSVQISNQRAETSNRMKNGQVKQRTISQDVGRMLSRKDSTNATDRYTLSVRQPKLTQRNANIIGGDDDEDDNHFPAIDGVDDIHSSNMSDTDISEVQNIEGHDVASLTELSCDEDANDRYRKRELGKNFDSRSNYSALTQTSDKDFYAD